VGANNSGKTFNRYDIYAALVPSVRQLWFSGKIFKKHLPEKDLDVENQTIEISWIVLF